MVIHIVELSFMVIGIWFVAAVVVMGLFHLWHKLVERMGRRGDSLRSDRD